MAAVGDSVWVRGHSYFSYRKEGGHYHCAVAGWKGCDDWPHRN